MQYTITRGTQTYGPYTLEDLQRYVASGNILPTDLAKSDSMPEPRTVAELLGSHNTGATSAPYPSQTATAIADGTQPPVTGAPVSPNAPFVAAPGFQAPAAAQPLAYTPYPDPPGLHWGLVLLFSVLTCSLFMVVWNLVISSWLRRVQPNANALFFYIAAYVIALLDQGARAGVMLHNVGTPTLSPMLVVAGLGGLTYFILKIFARFTEKASIEEHYRTVEPLGLELNGVLVFFFGGIYIQSQLNKVPRLRQQAAYGYNRGY